MSKKHGDEATLQETQTAQSHGANPAELASLMQIREILTGPLATDVEHRITEIDQRLDQRFQELTEQSAKRIDEIEHVHQSQVGKLNEELGDQRTQHQDRFERLERELNLGLEQMRTKIQDVTGQMSTTADSLRSELATEFEAIRLSIQELSDKITLRFDEEKLRLRDELVDRDTLSAALSEVAIRLAPPARGAHEVDAAHHEMELDQILEDATSGQY